MSKCPKCGCEFHETPLATVVIDETMPKNTWRLVSAQGTNIINPMKGAHFRPLLPVDIMGNCTDYDNPKNGSHDR